MFYFILTQSWKCSSTFSNSCWNSSWHCFFFQGYIPNCALAVQAMLATTSLGAIWSSTSPDFGVTVVITLPAHDFILSNFFLPFFNSSCIYLHTVQISSDYTTIWLKLSSKYLVTFELNQHDLSFSGCVGQIYTNQAKGYFFSGCCQIQQQNT